MKSQLLRYGLDTDALSSYVVNQNQLAMDAHDPMQLLHSIEKLTGTWSLHQQLSEISGRLEGNCQLTYMQRVLVYSR